MVFNVYVSGLCTCTPTGLLNTQLVVMRHNLLIHVQAVICFVRLVCALGSEMSETMPRSHISEP